MSTGDRQASAGLTARLSSEGHRFDFFQVVYLLEHYLGRHVALGGAGPCDEEGVRFRPNPSLGFSPADLARIETAGEFERQRGESWEYRLVVNFMGLYGVAAPSPVYFSELIGFEDVDADQLVDFLDLFNHRLISLYYRAWLRYRYPYRFDVGGSDELSGYLLAFLGLADPPARQGLGVPAFRLLKYIGLLSLRSHPPEALRRVLSDYLEGDPVAIRELVLRWVNLPPGGRTRLGQASSSLGRDLVVGQRVPDRTGKVRVSVGPLNLARFCELLPDQSLFAELCSLLQLVLFKRFEYDVELRLQASEVPDLHLGGAQPVRLGWTSFLSSGTGRGEDGVVWLQPPRPPATGETRA